MSMPYNGFPPGPPVPMGQPRQRRNRLTIVLAALAVLLAAAVGVVAAVVISGGGTNPFDPPKLKLESNSSTGDNPFAKLHNQPVTNAPRLAASQGAQTARGVRGVNGTMPGLYGGTGSETCDPAGLAQYLGADPAKASAWAGVYGISTDQIPYYLNTLTPVVLTADTWVTNHSYENGVATPFQSVLQAGTSVLVDSAGVPRVRCACGNPLGPPASAPLAGYRTQGAHWSYYDARQVVYVTYNTETTTVVNNTTTVVNAPAANPAAQSLSLLNLDGSGLIDRFFNGLIDVSSLPPLRGALPSPADLNVPFSSPNPNTAKSNGVSTNGQPLPEVVKHADAQTQAADGGGGGASESAAAGPSAPAGGESSAAAAPSDVPTTQVPTSDATTQPPADANGPATSSSAATSSAATSSRAVTPTRFSGSGSSVSELSFTPAGSSSSVRCTVPTASSSTSGESGSSTISLNCSSGTYEVSASSLTRSAVSSATDSSGVWTVPLTDSSGDRVSVAVTSATYE